MELPQTVGDRLGQELLGAAPGTTLIADSTSVCFYKLAAAALAARPGRRTIITDTDNFPTDRYIVEGLAEQTGRTIDWLQSDPRTGPQPEQLERMLANDDVALVTFSHVSYRSAQIADMHSHHADRARGRGARAVGSQPHRRRGQPANSTPTTSTSRSAAPTSTSTAARARPRSSTSTNDTSTS